MAWKALQLPVAVNISIESIIESFGKPECTIKYLCSRLQLRAGRSTGLLNVGHNSSCIPRALIVRWGLCVSIPKDLRRPPASSLEIPKLQHSRGYAGCQEKIPGSKGCLQISTGSKGIFTFRVGKPWMPNFVAKALFASSVASTCTAKCIGKAVETQKARKPP